MVAKLGKSNVHSETGIAGRLPEPLQSKRLAISLSNNTHSVSSTTVQLRFTPKTEWAKRCFAQGRSQSKIASLAKFTLINVKVILY